MNDLQIDYFMAVATNLSFTKTSEELFVSQPAISKQISMMEKELGVKLFDRNNKKTQLTEAGELFYEFFRDYKKELRETTRKAQALQNKETKAIHLGFLEGWDLGEILPEFMRRFKAEYPDTYVAIDCCGVKELSTMLLTNSVDVVLTLQNSVTEFDVISIETVAEVEKVLLYSSHSPLAEIHDLHPTDFKNEKFIAPWGIMDKVVRRVIESYCEPYGFRPNIDFVRNSESMITCVRNGLGVAVMDSWNWCIHAEDLRTLPLETTDRVCVAKVKSGLSEAALFAADLLADVVHEVHP